MPGVEKFNHIPVGVVTAGGTTAPAAGTTESWTVTATTAFPAAVASTVLFHVCDPAANTELILVTVSPGGTGAGQSWTVTRGVDGTTPVAHTGGFTIYQVVAASWLNDLIVSVPASGDTTGATDAAAINALLAAGDPVYLNPGSTYWINAPIAIQSQSFLTGFQWNMASQNDNYGNGVGQPTGAIIRAGSGFSGAAMVLFADPGSGQNFGADISGISVMGANLATGSGIHGISAIGAWGACYLRGIQVQKAPQDCLHFDVGSTGKVPDDWQITDCKFSTARTGYGVNIVNNLPDSWFDNCESSENTLAGWSINWCDNTRWSNCKGENNGTAGWLFTSISSHGHASLANCTSQLNSQDGFLFQSGTVGGQYLLTGCRSRDDNQAASTYAAFRANGALANIIGIGCSGTGAAYGAYEGGTSTGMWFTGSYFTGTTAALHDDGTNTTPLVSQWPAFSGGPAFAAVKTVTTTYTATSADFLIRGDATSASFQVTLPTTGITTGQIIVVKKIDSSGHDVQVLGGIDGVSNVHLSFQYSWVMAQFDGTNWDTVSSGSIFPGITVVNNGGIFTTDSTLDNGFGQCTIGAGLTTHFNTLDDNSGNAIFAGNVKLAAGTTSLAPVTFQSGTNLTSATAGDAEYDGASLYFTNETTSGRGLVPVEQRFRLTATGSNITTIANFFGSTSNISLVANAEYEIEIVCWFLKNTAGAVTWTFTNSAAPTSMTIDYQLSPATGIVTTAAATDLFGQQYNVTATAPTVVSASLTTAVNHRHKFRIRLINGSGTSLKIQATAGAGSITPGINSYWTCHRVPAANVGTFAA